MNKIDFLDRVIKLLSAKPDLIPSCKSAEEAAKEIIAFVDKFKEWDDKY